MDKKHYPTAFLVVIAIALYFMYGEQFSLKNVDFSAYEETCEKYLKSESSAFSEDEKRSLVNKINYLLPGSVDEIKDPQRKKIKACSVKLLDLITP